MANDKVAIWNQTIKLGRSPANGELLIGNGADFTLANITAGSGATVTNSAGGIQISATGSGGTVTSVTASSPLASSGGNTPDISLSGTVTVGHGGTGATTLTSNNVILGNGTSAVQFVAPGTNGNVLTSNGTTWTSAAPAAAGMSVSKKTSDQNLNTSSTTFQDVTGLSFTAGANKTYFGRANVLWSCPASGSNGGGIQLAMNGPASPTVFVPNAGTLNVTAYDTLILSSIAQNYTTYYGISFFFTLQNGANSGTVIVRAAQNTSKSGTTTVYAGSVLEWIEVA